MNVQQQHALQAQTRQWRNWVGQGECFFSPSFRFLQAHLLCKTTILDLNWYPNCQLTWSKESPALLWSFPLSSLHKDKLLLVGRERTKGAAASTFCCIRRRIVCITTLIRDHCHQYSTQASCVLWGFVSHIFIRYLEGPYEKTNHSCNDNVNLFPKRFAVKIYQRSCTRWMRDQVQGGWVILNSHVSKPWRPPVPFLSETKQIFLT